LRHRSRRGEGAKEQQRQNQRRRLIKGHSFFGDIMKLILNIYRGRLCQGNTEMPYASATRFLHWSVNCGAGV
jgi:hypothetical protein